MGQTHGNNLNPLKTDEARPGRLGARSALVWACGGLHGAFVGVGRSVRRFCGLLVACADSCGPVRRLNTVVRAFRLPHRPCDQQTPAHVHHAAQATLRRRTVYALFGLPLAGKGRRPGTARSGKLTKSARTGLEQQMHVIYKTYHCSKQCN